MIEFRPFLERGEIGLDCADGAYLSDERDGVWQVTVVGPMRGTPGEYVDTLTPHLGLMLELRKVFVLTPGPEVPLPTEPNVVGMAEQILRRGFVGIVVGRRNAAMVSPGPDSRPRLTLVEK